MIWLNYQSGLLRLFLVNLFRAVVVFFSVYVLLAFMGSDDDLQQISWSVAGMFVLVVLDSVLPWSLLVATLFTVGPRAHFKELSALNSVGFSMLQIMWPMLGVGVLATVSSAVLRLSGVLPGGPPLLSTAAEQTAFHAKMAYPLVNLFAVVAGVILASSPIRKSIYGGFLRALLFVFAFNVVAGVAQALGRQGVWHPVLAGWLGSITAAALLLALWYRARL
ncbi:MAG: LptF/LptG family permease [Candidatus Krumholzibacteriota bacterium]